MKKNVRTVVSDLAVDSAPESLEAIPASELELVAGGMQCDKVGTAQTYDPDDAVCRSDIVYVCG